MSSILEVLHDFITRDDRRLLEIGSGFGESAIEFAPAFPYLEWHPTEGSSRLKSLSTKVAEAGVKNIQKPIRMEVGKDELPKLKFDLIFTKNTFHQMQWKECKSLMKQFGGRLREGSRVLIYGPFKYDGQFVSPAHEALDKEIKSKDPLKGIRSFEDVNNVMLKNGFELIDDIDMPDDNQMLVYNRLKFVP